MATVFDSRRSRYLLLALVLVHLAVVSRQVDAGGVSLLERAVFQTFSPLQRAVAASVRAVRSLWSGYVGLRGVHHENRRLREELAARELELQRLREQALEAARLRELLDLQPVLPLPTLVANVIARDGAPWYRTLTVDRGTRDGVPLNAAVLSPTGVVGRVIEVGPGAARVQLLLDKESGAGVLIERSRVTGVLEGQVTWQGGRTDLVMKYVPVLADVLEGDVVVTSGFDRIYPKGLMVGRVRLVRRGSGLFKEILVSPSARFDQLETVLVVRETRAEPTFTETVR